MQQPALISIPKVRLASTRVSVEDRLGTVVDFVSTLSEGENLYGIRIKFDDGTEGIFTSSITPELLNTKDLHSELGVIPGVYKLENVHKLEEA